MSDFGLMVWNSTDEVIFDSRNAQGGVCGGAFEVAQGATQTVSFPQYAGRSARVLGAFIGSPFSSVSYSSGYPSVQLFCPPTFVSPSYFVIFIY